MTASQIQPSIQGARGRQVSRRGVEIEMLSHVNRTRVLTVHARQGGVFCRHRQRRVWGIVGALLLSITGVRAIPLEAQERHLSDSRWDHSQAPDAFGYAPFPSGSTNEGGSVSEPYLDLENYLSEGRVFQGDSEDWAWQILPDGLIYRPYVAGPKESRLSSQVVRPRGDNWLWEATLGQQTGLLRWGSFDPDFPVGFQVDVEGSAQVRLDIQDEVDVRSVDFRGGVPLTFGYGPHRTKLAYYHISSHLGDEFLLKNPDFNRLNFARDALVLGHAIYLTPSQRVFAEAGWAFYRDVAKEWEFQFGYEFNPVYWMTRHGSPYFAVHAHLREEVNFGGGLAVQTGWAWRAPTGRQLRMGMHYYNGKSPQYSFFNDHEQLIGFIVAFDR